MYEKLVVHFNEDEEYVAACGDPMDDEETVHLTCNDMEFITCPDCKAGKFAAVNREPTPVEVLVDKLKEPTLALYAELLVELRDGAVRVRGPVKLKTILTKFFEEYGDDVLEKLCQDKGLSYLDMYNTIEQICL